MQTLIIIIIYFEKTSAFFHAKVGRLPQEKQPIFGDTLKVLTRPLADQSPSGSCLSMGIGANFGDQISGIKQLRIREEMLENLATSSAVIEFPPPYSGS